MSERETLAVLFLVVSIYLGLLPHIYFYNKQKYLMSRARLILNFSIENYFSKKDLSLKHYHVECLIGLVG